MTLISLPLTSKARKPPVKARGTVVIITIGVSNDWNWATMMRYIRSNASPIINSRSFIEPEITDSSPETAMR